MKTNKHGRVFLWAVIVIYTLLAGFFFPPALALLVVYAVVGIGRAMARVPGAGGRREKARRDAQHARVVKLVSKL